MVNTRTEQEARMKMETKQQLKDTIKADRYSICLWAERVKKMRLGYKRLFFNPTQLRVLANRLEEENKVFALCEDDNGIIRWCEKTEEQAKKEMLEYEEDYNKRIAEQKTQEE